MLFPEFIFTRLCKKVFLAMLLATTILLGCKSSPLTVSQVISADTVVLSDGRKIHYAGLEAPEKNSPMFDFCRDANTYLVQDKPVQLTLEQNPGNPSEVAKDANVSNETVFAYIYTPIRVGEETKFLFVHRPRTNRAHASGPFDSVHPDKMVSG